MNPVTESWDVSEKPNTSKMDPESSEAKVTKEEIPKQLPSDTSQPLYKHQDFVLWIVSLVLFLALAAAMMGIGAYRGWDANSGYSHNVSVTSSKRFWSEPFVDEPGVKGRYGADANFRWYYWKLPPPEVTWLTRGVMWVCYMSHQFTVWLLVYAAQRKQNENDQVTYSHKFRWFNVALYGANVFFHLLHLGQTHWTYDALAQDTSIASSQGSVVVMVAFIFVLEYRDRGLAFGWPSQYDNNKISNFFKLPYSSMYLVRKYHGYAFAWAAVYTMWYHPMESTMGHVMGFFHTYIILVQASLVYTPMHLNKYWRFLLEGWVAVHATWVAVQTGGPDKLGTSMWPRFCFGFFIGICVTQLFGLPFWRRLPAAVRIAPLMGLLVIIIGMYSWIPDDQGRPWTRIYEVTFIPMSLILFPILIFGTLFVLLKIDACFSGKNQNDSTFLQGFFLTLGLIMFMLCVLLGFSLEFFHWELPMQVSMVGLWIVYPIAYCFGLLFIKHAFNKKDITRPVVSVTEPTELELDITK